MNRYRFKHIAAAAAALALTAGACTNADLDGVRTADDCTLAFNVGVSGAASLDVIGTRASQLLSSASQISSIKVTGWNNVSPDYSRFIAGYKTMSVADGKATSDIHWTTPLNKQFFACANLPAEGATVASDAHTGQTLSYTVPAEVSAQKDILLAAAAGVGDLTTITGYRALALNFKHALAAVRFKVGTVSGLSNISNIKLSGVYAGGTVPQNADGSFGTVTGSGALTMNQNVSIATLTTGNVLGDEFIVIPSNPGSVTLMLTGTAHGQSGSVITANLGTDVWTPGHIIEYTINYEGGSGLTLTCSISDWGTNEGISSTFDDLPAPEPSTDEPVATSNSLTFSWNAVAGADGYKATLYQEGGSATSSVSTKAGTTSPMVQEVTEPTVTFEGLEKGTKYICEVVAGKKITPDSDQVAYSGESMSLSASTITGPDPRYWVDLGAITADGHKLYFAKYNVASIDDNGNATFADTPGAAGGTFTQQQAASIKKANGQDCRLPDADEFISICSDFNTTYSYSNSIVTLTSKLQDFSGNSISFISNDDNTDPIIREYICSRNINFYVINNHTRFVLGPQRNGHIRLVAVSEDDIQYQDFELYYKKNKTSCYIPFDLPKAVYPTSNFYYYSEYSIVIYPVTLFSNGFRLYEWTIENNFEIYIDGRKATVNTVDYINPNGQSTIKLRNKRTGQERIYTINNYI